MNLDKISIDTRLRTPWQAVDLGFCFAKHHYFKLLILWVAPMLLVAVISTLLFSKNLYIAWFIIWWFKPLYDRAPLFYASRALFGETPPLSTVFKSLFTIYRFDWLPSLTWRRFSFTRSFDLPITLLEQLSGKKRSRRKDLLHNKHSGVAVALSFVCILFESTIAYGSYLLIAVLIPEQANLNLVSEYMSNNAIIGWLEHVFYLAAMPIIAPFYICAGFLLYINRRIELEAWDVEIQFRKMASKAHNENRPLKSLSIMLPLSLALGFSTIFSPNIALADSPHSDNKALTLTPLSTPEQAKELINQVLASDDFQNEKQVSGWRLKQKNEDEDSKSWFESFLEWLEKSLNLEGRSDNKDYDLNSIAKVIEIAFWLLFSSMIAWIIYRYRSHLGNLANILPNDKRDKVDNAPKSLFGLEITKESLPLNIVAEVNRLSETREYRNALSLLYRATLSQLIHQKQLSFADSSTEIECLNVVKTSKAPDLIEYTERLTNIWQTMAYGHNAPKQQALADLCMDYSRIFDT